MSQANASARKRRAPPPAVSPPGSNPQQQSQSQSAPPNMNSGTGLTLPQVILLVDKRLTTLEKFMNTTNTLLETQDHTPLPSENEESPKLQEIIEEFNTRYSILAEEIGNIKNTLLSLQTFTMEVNHKLVQQYITTPTVVQDPLDHPIAETKTYVVPESLEESIEEMVEI